jgi:alpha-amylase
LLNAARKGAIEYSPAFLTTPVRLEPVEPKHFLSLLPTQMKFMAVEDHSMAISKPPILALFTNVGNESTQGVNWKVGGVFHPNEQLVDVLTCAKVIADEHGGVNTSSAHGMPQVLMPIASLRQGGAVCPDVATGVQAKSAGLPGVRVTWAVVFASTLLFVLGRGRWV